MIGQTIGKYKIEKMIGAGGMGEVYLARDTMLNRTVALKFLPRDLESRDRVVKRFIREAQAAARLSHPYIATIYGIEQFDGRYCILMEYVDGEPLSRILRRETLSPKQVVRYAIQIAEALAEAHENGVLHRDIKPGNILITRKQQVKVLDFGLAKFLDSEPVSNHSINSATSSSKSERITDELTREGVLVGTPKYMSPEQILGKNVDQRSDIFSFGTLLYEMLTNHHPFKAENNQQLVVIISTEDPPDLKSFVPDLPDELVAAVMKALNKMPQSRYQTAREMAAELRALSLKLFPEHFLDFSGAEEFLSSIPPLNRSSTPPVNDPDKTVTLGDAELTKGAKENAKTSASIIWQRRPVRLLALILLLVITVGGGVWFYKSRNATKLEQMRPVIAVMYFDNFTNDPTMDWLGRGLTEMFTTDLAQVRNLEVVSKQRLFDTLQAIGKNQVQTIDHSTASEVARKVGAEAILSGSVLKINNRLRLNITLEEISSGKIILSDSVEGNSIDEIFGLVDSITTKVTRYYNPTNATDNKPLLSNIATNSVEAFRLYTRGVERCWATNFDEGLDDLERAVEVDDQFAIAYLQIGNAKFVRNDSAGAKEAFDKALKYIDHTGYREQLLIKGVNAYYGGYDTGDFGPALAIFQQMQANYANDKEVYLWMGLTQWRNGDYKKAIASYNRILELNPEFNQMYISLAQAYADDEDYVSASTILRKSTTLRPANPDARTMLGNIYTRMGRYDDAIKEYEAVVELRKEYRNYRPYLNLGQVYLLKGDPAKAQEQLQAYIDLSKDLVGVSWAHFALYRNALAQGQSQEAEKHLQTALQVAEQSKNPSAQTMAYCYLSSFYMFMERKLEARAMAREAMATAGFDMGGREASEQLALVLLEQENPELALASLQDYFKKLPEGTRKNTTDVQRVLEGAIAFRNKNYEQSEKFWLPPLKYNIHLYSRLALAQFQLNKYEAATENFKKLINRNGFDPERRGVYWSYQNPEYAVVLAYYYLGRIEEANHKPQQARSYYEEFLAHWGKADFSRPEITDAQTRLNALK